MSFFGNNGKEFLSIGGFSIATYAVCIMVGIIVAAYFAIKEGEKLGVEKNIILDGVLFCVPLAILGARLYYVAFEFDNIIKDGFLNIFNIAGGGLAITGGIITSIIFVIVYSKIKDVNPLKLFDVLAPGLLIGQIFGRWGNFFNQEAHGGAIENLEVMYKIFPDFIINHMKIGGVYYHPTFLYEAMWNLLGLCLILVIRRKIMTLQIGDLIGVYLFWYGIGRAVLIEPFRTDALMFLDIRVNVVLSAVMAVSGIVYIVVKRTKFPQQLYPHCINEVEQIKELENYSVEN